MGKFDNIAILTDLDRTFLADGAKIVDRNLEAIEYFKSCGGIFTLATGRMHFNLDSTVPQADKLVNAPAIMCNGTYFYDFQKKKVFSERYMDAKAAYGAVQLVHALFESVFIRGCGRNGYIVDTVDKRAEQQLLSYGITTYTAVPYKDWNTDKWYKIVFEDDAENLKKVEKTLKAEFPEIFEYNRSRSTLLEIQMNGVNKSTLIDDLKKIYADIGRHLTVYACGDNENDIAMLRKADVAVCPANAIDKVKSVSDMCLCSNNDGVIADLIYNLEKF